MVLKKGLLFCFLIAQGAALQPRISRRNLLLDTAIVAPLVGGSSSVDASETAFLSVSAGFHDIRDDEIVEAQQFRGDKLDLNNAGVVEYKV